jgi:hypothetical protein
MRSKPQLPQLPCAHTHSLTSSHSLAQVKGALMHCALRLSLRVHVRALWPSLSLTHSLTLSHTRAGQRPQLPSDFLCEFMCGFYGTYGEVVKHETTCTISGCSLSSRSLLKISTSLYVSTYVCVNPLRPHHVITS